MKRIVKIVFVLIPVFLLPAVIMTAQEKEKEKHVKIVVVDKSGTKIEIDTLMKGDKTADSIKLKNGEVIYLTRHGKQSTITHMEGDKGNMVVTWSSTESDSKGGKYIYINEDKNTGEKGEKAIEVKVTTDDNDNKVEMTKYVIAKDGMVVTVEGNDEAKAKEILKEVESKLGVSKEDKNTKKK